MTLNPLAWLENIVSWILIQFHAVFGAIFGGRELHCRPTSRDVIGEVLAIEKIQIALDGNHRRKAIP